MNTTAPHFASILDEAPTEINRPKPLPEGTYLCVVGQPEEGKSSKKGTPFIKFPLKPIAAMDDVDEAALVEVGGIESKNLSTTYYITPDAVFMLDQFHSHCGIDLGEEVSRRVRNSEVVNTQVLAVVKHRMSEDNTQSFAEVRQTGLAE